MVGFLVLFGIFYFSSYINEKNISYCNNPEILVSKIISLDDMHWPICDIVPLQVRGSAGEIKCSQMSLPVKQDES